jgi:hypothetical protein
VVYPCCAEMEPAIARPGTAGLGLSDSPLIARNLPYSVLT